MVLRPPKEFKKVMKKQYSKWEFFNTAKLYWGEEWIERSI
jgi:hypothetical protein